jgi:hypothetical protein
MPQVTYRVADCDTQRTLCKRTLPPFGDLTNIVPTPAMRKLRGRSSANLRTVLAPLFPLAGDLVALQTPHDRNGLNDCASVLRGSRGVSISSRRSAPRPMNAKPYSRVASAGQPSADSLSIVAAIAPDRSGLQALTLKRMPV